jgi:pyridoxal phosphate enzyme (YggS family)
MPLADIEDRIRTACAAAGRARGEVTLIAVSKLQPEERVDAVLGAGHRVFGENYVQEAQARWPSRRLVHPDIRLHLVGPLQTNKAKVAVELFDAIHSVDRPSLAEKLARLAEARGICPELFVQVNTGAEPQKAGVLPEAAEAFVTMVRALGLPAAGLMCIPPDGVDPAPHFEMLARLAQRVGLKGLSMGMSGDFETAIAHGATHLRIGSAIFGARPARTD